MAVTKAFYSGLFGWTFTDVPVGSTLYSQAYLDGVPVAGAIQTPIASGDHRQPAWLSFMSTPDVDATAALAVKNGARQLLAPRVIPGRGKEAIYADPQGAVFGLLTSERGDPADVSAAPGEWVWSALVASNPDQDAAFYQTLFNYDVYELPSEGPTLHLILASDHFSRASANGYPEHVDNVHSHWMNFIRVDDTVASAAKVQKLGGSVLVEPHVDRHGGKVAIVADPSGAPFGLMELGVKEAQSPGAAK
jgi:predicted enzyme related to lactoylglutathione lyase